MFSIGNDLPAVSDKMPNLQFFHKTVAKWTQKVHLQALYYRQNNLTQIFTSEELVMLGFILFIIIVVGIYSNLESTQRKQGGKPLKDSSIIRGGCGCILILIIFGIICAFVKQC